MPNDADPFDRVVDKAKELIQDNNARLTRINVSSNILMNKWTPIIRNSMSNANPKLRAVGLVFRDAQAHQTGDQSTNILVTSESTITERPFPSLKFTIDDEGLIKADVRGATFEGFPVFLEAHATKPTEIISILADYAEKCLIQANGRK